MRIISILSLGSLWAIYLPSLFLTVFTPSDEQSRALFGLLIIEGPTERFLNLLLLMPLGVLLFVTFPEISKWKLFFSGPILSASIEMVQGFIPGRTPDLVDLLMNSLGYLFASWICWRKVRRIPSRILPAAPGSGTGKKRQ